MLGEPVSDGLSQFCSQSTACRAQASSRRAVPRSPSTKWRSRSVSSPRFAHASTKPEFAIGTLSPSGGSHSTTRLRTTTSANGRNGTSGNRSSSGRGRMNSSTGLRSSPDQRIPPTCTHLATFPSYFSASPSDLATINSESPVQCQISGG
jgi:hypothetical protein